MTFAEEALNQAGPPEECISNLINLIRKGEFLDEVKAHPLRVIACIMKVTLHVMERFDDHDDDAPEPLVIGSDRFLSQCQELCECEGKAIAGSPEAAGGLLGTAVLSILLPILRNRLAEAIEEFLRDR